jgi:hypothetical protein
MDPLINRTKNDPDLLNRVIAGDESWVYEYDDLRIYGLNYKPILKTFQSHLVYEFWNQREFCFQIDGQTTQM